MLIQDTNIVQTNKRQLLFNLIKAALAITLLSLLLINFAYPFFLLKSSEYDKNIIHCDAEKTWKNIFFSNGKTFSSGRSQSQRFAHHGKYSCKFEQNKKAQYGFGYLLNDAEDNAFYEVSVWRYRTNKKDEYAYLNIYSEKPDSSIQQAINTSSFTDKNGWELLKDTFQYKNISGQHKVNIFVHSNGRSEVYFDDLIIKKIDHTSPNKINTNSSFSKKIVKLMVNKKNYAQLQKNRKKALKEGMLITNAESWVKGKLHDKDETLPVKLRLKGDWLDHLQKDKWSFRVKVKDPFAWNRMITFSFQSPQTRYFTMEWLMHELWSQEDVISPRYDFVQLYLNDKNLGWYAFEEHFDKQLVEYKSRREGPIVRFSEDALWDTRVIQQNIYGYTSNKTKPPGADQSGAEITAFKASKIQQSANLSQQFEIAKTLLHQYQFGLKKPAEVFHLDLMAKFVALADLAGSYHSMIWHNQRFYYNPVIGKLEPIGYDAFTTGQPEKMPWTLSSVLFKRESYYDTRAMDYLIEDIEFQKRYLHFLFKFCQDDYLNAFFEKINLAWESRSIALKSEFPKFSYDVKKELFRKASIIKKQLVPLGQHALKAYWTKQKNGTKILSVTNTHFLPLQILGYGGNDKIITTPAANDLYLKRLKKKEDPPYKMVEAPEAAKFVFFKLPGLDSTFVASISPFALPRKETPYQEIVSNLKLKSNNLFSINQKEVRFKAGKYTVTKDIIIPDDYTVYFDAGVELNLLQKAKFISYAPVMMHGTKEQPIRIYSEDKSGNGFNVLQAKRESKVDHVVFHNLKNLDYKGWQLTGAVTFYESDVNISNSFFRSNHCEDILNIIRSKFTIDNCKFSDTFGDAFDGDFAEGVLKNSTFFRTGNDAADFSGSNIIIENCKFEMIGDKGISVGEQSEVTARKIEMTTGVIGVASKDLSKLYLEDISITDFSQAFTAYQKKPEFGPSKIEVKEYQVENCDRVHAIAPGSSLTLDGKTVDVLQ